MAGWYLIGDIRYIPHTPYAEWTAQPGQQHPSHNTFCLSRRCIFFDMELHSSTVNITYGKCATLLDPSTFPPFWTQVEPTMFHHTIAHARAQHRFGSSPGALEPKIGRDLGEAPGVPVPPNTSRRRTRRMGLPVSTGKLRVRRLADAGRTAWRCERDPHCIEKRS